MKWDMELKREITELDLNSPIIAQKKPISRFVITSALVHFIIASAILINNHVRQNEVEKELVEVEFSVPSESESAPEVFDVSQVEASNSVGATVEPEAVESQERVEPSVVAPIAQNERAEDEKEIAQTKPVQKIVTVVKQEEVPTPKPLASAESSAKTVEEPKATLDDIETPTLETEVPVTPVAAVEKTNAEDMEKKLQKIEAENAQKADAIATQLNEETQQIENSLAESTAEAEAIIKEEEAKRAAVAAARAEALRKEKADAEAAAAEKLAAENLAATKASGASDRNAGPGAVDSEVRALESLKQMPGNPKPMYDAHERLQGHQGIIVFQAFVTADGRLTDFKLVRSTGHRNLDSKTLKALKQWKFYPGQEGWVELPFNWNLKGGPQEMPALLRRKVGQGS